MKTPGIGDNKMPLLDEYQGLVDDKLKALDEWEKYKDVPDEEVAERLRDYIAGVKALASDTESMRKDEKQPFLDKAARVDDKWRPLTDRLRRALEFVEGKLDRYMREKKRKQAEEERKAREAAAEARRVQEEAVKQAADAKRASERIENEARASEAGKLARKNERVAEKAAAPTRVASATGMTRAAGFARERKAKVVDPKKAFATLMKKPAAKMALLVEMERQANTLIRASHGADIDLPGFEINEGDKLRA